MAPAFMRLIFLAYMCFAASIIAPAAVPKAIGQEVGELVRAADERVAVGGGASTYHSSLISAVQSIEEGMVNPHVAQVIADANGVAGRTTVADDGVCVRKWAQACPDGWTTQANICIAPLSYNGPCKAVQRLAGSTISEKHRFAMACKAPWPCEDQCAEGHDYEVCPEGWFDEGHGFCKAASASLQCSQKYKFDEMAIDEKQDIASACGFQWPCKKVCARDYSAKCPETWIEVVQLCAAPPNYAGDCHYSVNVSGMTEDQKRSFAVKCSAQFPCQDRNNASKKPLGSERSRHPINYGDGPIHGVGGSSSAPVGFGGGSHEASRDRFTSRFTVPSGPIDVVGDVHF